MLFPKTVLKPMLMMGISASAAIIAAGLAMTQLIQADVIISAEPEPLLTPQYEMVTQSVTAPGTLAVDDCPITLDLIEDPNAMIGITLLAPCLPSADVMISHAGMVFTAKTMASGALLLGLPALTADATVSVRFDSGAQAENSITIPSVKGLQRFVVQWPETDGFAIHAYEGDAAFEDAGHIWAENLATPLASDTPKTGYLTPLGDANTDMPMLAQVYTFPPSVQSDVVVEAEVTENTCGADLMGDTISSIGGLVTQDEITVAMPDCGAVGEFVQIGGLAPDLNLALAD